MTDQFDTLRRLVEEAEAKGHAYMVLAISGRARRSSKRITERVRIVPGLLGTLLSTAERDDSLADLVVEVVVADARAWLERRAKETP